MNKVCQSSDTIRSTAKIIDEAAFQADLLALNAAVETALGRGGRPLRVLAEEARTLAQGRAQAASGPAARVEEPSPGELDGGERLQHSDSPETYPPVATASERGVPGDGRSRVRLRRP